MAIEKTPFQEEINEILLNGPNPVHFQWRCTIEFGDYAFDPLKFFSIDLQRMYDVNFADYILVDVLVPLGVYKHNLIPNKEELTVVISRVPVGEHSADETLDEQDIVSRRYKAVITNEKSHLLIGQDNIEQQPEMANLADLVRFEMQLLDLGLEELRLREVGGIYRNEIPGEVIKYILSDLSSSLDLPEEDAILGVDMVEPDNLNPSKHVIIPHGTKPQDVSTYIQEEAGGVYNTGIGCYLQDGIWYVWPEYNLRRFETELKTATILNIPPDKYPGIERTYRVTDNQTIILSTGEVSHMDLSHHEQLNQGNGLRFAHGDRIMDGYGTVSNNQFTLERKKNVTEIHLLEKPGPIVAPLSKTRITNNTFSEVSKVAKRQGSVISLVWENSQPDLIYPGMPVKFLFIRNDEVEEIEGVLLRCNHYIYDNRPGVIRGKHVCNTNLVLFVDKIE